MNTLRLIVTKFRAPGMGLVFGLTSVPGLVIANPLDGQLVQGSAEIASQGTTLTVRQHSQTAVLDWRDFSIGAGETTRFEQPSVSALAVNRVIGDNMSQILGSLQANGRVMLLNQNGVHFGPDSRVDVASLVVSTQDLTNDQILKGDFSFAAPTNPDGMILNQGLITAKEGGLVALVSPRVVNQGIITAQAGSISIGAGEKPTLDFYGDGLIQFALDDAGVSVPETASQTTPALIENSGTLQADGGLIQITARAAAEVVDSAINLDGLVQAQSLAEHQGRILLEAEGGEIRIAGQLDTSGVEDGGQIQIHAAELSLDGELLALGDSDGDGVGKGGQVQLQSGSSMESSTALIDVSGAQGGQISNSAAQQLTSAARYVARGEQGDGGEIRLWSDLETIFQGSIDARANGATSLGGLVEISSAGDLTWSLSEIQIGAGGELLIDPKNITIVSSLGSGETALGDWSFSSTASGKILASDLTTLLKAGTNVTLQASNDLTLTTDLLVNNNSGDGGDLTMQAGRSMFLGGSITTDNGDLKLVANETLGAGIQNGFRDPGIAEFTMASGATISAGTGAVSIILADGAGKSNAESGDITLGSITGRTLLVWNDGDKPVGDIVVNGQLGTSGAGESLVLATNGNFVNNVGPSALSAGAGRYLVYSTSPGGNTLEGLTADPWYNARYPDNQPASIPQGSTGNRLVYSIAPNLTITAANQTRTYGSDNAPFTYGVSGLIGGDLQANALSGSPSLSSIADASSNVGFYSIDIGQGTLTSPYNYGLVFNNGILRVNPAPITVSTSDVIKTYDGNTIALGTPILVSGSLFNDDFLSGATFLYTSPDAGTGKTVIVTGVTINDGNGGANYRLSTLANTTSTINKAPLSVSATNATRLYGEPNSAIELNYLGFVNGEDPSVIDVPPTASTSAVQGSNVGSYSISISGGSDNNYDITTSAQPGTLYITPRPITVTSTDVIKTYDATTDALGSLLITAGSLFGSDTLSSASFAFTDPNAGTGKTVTISGLGVIDGNGGNNYLLTNLSNTNSTIFQAPLSVTTSDVIKTYDGTVFAAGTPIVTSGTLYGSDSLTGGSFAFTDPNAGVGKTVTVTGINVNDGNGGANYQLTSVDNTNSTINQAPLFISASNVSRFYGDPNSSIALIYSGFVNGETFSVLDVLPTPISTATQGTDVGSYGIDLTGGSDNNYAITLDPTPGTLTINPRPISVSTSDVIKTYDATTAASGTPIVVAGSLYGTDTIGGGSFAFTDPNAGTGKTVTVNGILVNDGNMGFNYNVALVNNTTSTILGAPISVTTSDVTKTYDGTLFAAGTPLLVSGTLYSGDVLTGGSFAFTDPNAGIGKTVTVTGITVNNGSSGNYQLTPVPNTNSTINQAPLVVTTSGATRIYGDPNTSILLDYAGLVNGESYLVVDTPPTINTPATQDSNVGSYAITLSGGSDNNYNLLTDSTPGTLQITPRPITASTADVIRDYDGTTDAIGIPVVILGSLYGSDTLAGGEYAFTDPNAGFGKTVTVSGISVNDGNGGNNYELTLANNNTSVINGVQLSVTTSDVIKTYDGTTFADGTPIILVGNLYGSDALTGATFAFTDPNAGIGKTVVITSISINGGGAGNYQLIPVANSNSIIEQAPLLVSVSSATRPYGESNADIILTYSGFVNGEDASVLDLPPTPDTTATQDSDVGSYGISISGGSDNNYVLTTDPTPGLLVITPRLITVSSSDVTRVYDGTTQADASPVVVEGSLYGTDQLTGGSFAFTDANAGSGKTVTVNGIQVEDGNGGNNYELTAQDNTHSSITPADLRVTADDQTRVEGEPNPPLTLTYEGFVNGESESDLDTQASASTDADETSPSGDYVIAAAGASSRNYSIAHVDGTLVVQPGETPVDPSILDPESGIDTDPDTSDSRAQGGTSGQTYGQTGSDSTLWSVEQDGAAGDTSGGDTQQDSSGGTEQDGSASTPAVDQTGTPEASELIEELLDDLADAPPQQVPALQQQIVDVLEQQGRTQLDAYFGEHLSPLDEIPFDASQLATDTAILYPIALPDRLVLMLVSRHGRTTVDVAVDQASLDKTLDRFRNRLQNRQNNRFLYEAQELYQWLIQPMKATLDDWGVTTLVLVPTDRMRTVPLAALHDGRQFLVEQYALAITPSVELYPPRAPDWSHGRVLAAGLSDAVQGFTALPSVPRELDSVASITNGVVLLNRDYKLDELRGVLSEHAYSAVHLATHAQFKGDPANNFLLTYDQHMTLDLLKDVIGSERDRSRILELLSISACQSALGDDKAALGLAGTAVKVGARAALGTLWFVDDQATALVMRRFYQELFAGKGLNKAEALQQAQQEILQDRRFRHPLYWAAFLMIGNWM